MPLRSKKKGQKTFLLLVPSYEGLSQTITFASNAAAVTFTGNVAIPTFLLIDHFKPFVRLSYCWSFGLDIDHVPVFTQVVVH